MKLTDEEYVWFKNTCPWIRSWYFEYLKNYRYDPKQVEVCLDNTNNLCIDVKGKWSSAIYWEVPLMAIISELYFKMIDKNWKWEAAERINYRNMTMAKMKTLLDNDCPIAEFGLRRRRSGDVQSCVLEASTMNNMFTNFVGTSNVYLAMKYGVKPIGTCAHEWISAHAILESMNHPNYYAMNNWSSVYNQNLGVFLPDTFTTDAFLKNFNIRFAKLFTGVRQDSGDPFIFADKMIDHYKKLGIDPLTKTIIFSDALNVDKCVKLKKYCENKIKSSFAIGTNFSNDFGKESPALNMVIKLWKINDRFAVKLSDTEGKEMGDKDAIRVMKWIHCGKPLDR